MTIITIHDASTGEVLTREMTLDEIEAHKIVQAGIKAERLEAEAEAKAKAIAKQAILDRLGLTADEAVLLLG